MSKIAIYRKKISTASEWSTLVPNVCSVCVSPWSGRLMLLLVLDYTLVSRLKTVIDAATEPHTKTQFPIKSQIFKIVLEISSWSHFSYNFTLNNFSKACIPVKWIFSEICEKWYRHELSMWSDAEASDQNIWYGIWCTE